MAGKHVSIGELAAIIDRAPHTIRGWERDGVLPKKLCGKRGKGGRRYWTENQVEQIRAWMARAKIGPGSGLVNFSPDADKASEMLAKLRAPRPKTRNKRRRNGPGNTTGKASS